MRVKKQQKISQSRVIIYMAYKGLTFKEVRNFFIVNGMEYNHNSIKTTFYKARWQQFKCPDLTQGIKDALDLKIAEMLLLTLPERDLSNYGSLSIQGDYDSSINTLINPNSVEEEF